LYYFLLADLAARPSAYKAGDVGISSVGSGSGYMLEIGRLDPLLRHNSRVWRQYTRLCMIVGLTLSDTEAVGEGVLSAVGPGYYIVAGAVARGCAQTDPCQPSCC
jgi:hypothetical protein